MATILQDAYITEIRTYHWCDKGQPAGTHAFYNINIGVTYGQLSGTIDFRFWVSYPNTYVPAGNKDKGLSMKSLDKLKDNIRDITRRTQGVNLIAVIDILNPFIRGHVNYFRLGKVQTIYRKLDGWVRMRLRCFKF